MIPSWSDRIVPDPDLNRTFPFGEGSTSRNLESIKTETALDGLYVIRTSVKEDKLDAFATVQAYKSLSQVERAFRSIKTVERENPSHLSSPAKSGLRLTSSCVC